MRTPAINEIDISIKKSISWTPRKASTILFLLNDVFINHKSIMISISDDVRFEMQIVIIIYDLSFRCNSKYNKYKIVYPLISKKTI